MTRVQAVNCGCTAGRENRAAVAEPRSHEIRGCRAWPTGAPIASGDRGRGT
ncbi:Uncharacterised protein [Mycobacteroides abscessus subsp. abscessus]|nr:Uncharacterised protein [Mycobacteroides abscessus subsp. abscessus]